MSRERADRRSAGTDLQRCIAKAERRQNTPGQRPHAAFTCDGFSIDEIVPPDGNKPISSLSDATEPHDVSVMD